MVGLIDKAISLVNFTNDGFAPPKLTYTSILSDVTIKNVTQNSNSKDTFIMPEAISEAIILATDANGEIIGAQYCMGELKYTQTMQDVATLHILA